jgi:hypothetical protein
MWLFVLGADGQMLLQITLAASDKTLGHTNGASCQFTAPTLRLDLIQRHYLWKHFLKPQAAYL